MAMELENIVANTVYLKAREGEWTHRLNAVWSALRVLVLVRYM